MADAGTPALSILIVSYNTRAMTLACLDSVVRETQQVAYEIIVVDNASIDGSAAAIAAHPAAPRLIALDDNIGFARANNLAATHARGRLVLLLNPDTEVQGGAIDALVTFAHRNPLARIWGGRTTFADGRLNPSSAWAQMSAWGLACRATGLTGLWPNNPICNPEAYGGWLRDSERDVDIVSGCFLLIERQLWQQLGGFDADYFMYGEDADLCLRAKALGASPCITPAATIVHHGGASETVRADKMVRLLTAKSTLVRRFFPRHLVGPGLALQALWPLSRAIAHAVRARTMRHDGSAREADIWRQIWRRRGEWLPGYGRTTPSVSSGQPTHATP